MAEEATETVGQPLALADRSAGREGLAATRTIGPKKWNDGEDRQERRRRGVAVGTLRTTPQSAYG